MYGDIVRLSNDVIVVEGRIPFTILFQTDTANALLYRSGGTLYIMDTGATPFFRKRILAAAEMLRPFGKLVLLNSHGHPDHTPNNSIIHEIAAKEKRHLISEKSWPLLDYESYFLANYREIGKYFFIADGPRPPFNFIMQPLKLLRHINEDLPYFMIKRVLKKFAPLEPSRETMEFFEKEPARTLPVKGAAWTGWNLGGDVYALEARGHTPDEVVFYLPREKVLFLSDESFDYFSCWPDSSARKVREVIMKSIAMARAGEVEALINGHHHEVLRGDDIIPFLESLVANWDSFTTEVKDIVAQAPGGLTAVQIYRAVRRRRRVPAVKRFLSLEFPKMPGFLKTAIVSMLLEEGYRTGGPDGHRLFFAP